MNLIKKEIRTHCILRHENIINLYNYDYNNNRVFLILEYAEKGNLYNYLRNEKINENEKKKKKENKNGKKNDKKNELKILNEFQKRQIFIKTCEAVAFMHANNLIHRDIKPENILLDKNLDPKLCDFGWSAKVQKNEIRATFCGTYEYMAPEVFESEDYNENIDVWSLGILLYEIYHGSSPFVGKSAFKIYKNIVAGNISFNKALDPLIIDLILKILKIDPDERPSVYDILEHPFMNIIKNKCLKTNLVSLDKKTKKSKKKSKNKFDKKKIYQEYNINLKLKNEDLKYSNKNTHHDDEKEILRSTENKNLRSESKNLKKEFFYKDTENKNFRKKSKNLKKKCYSKGSEGIKSNKEKKKKKNNLRIKELKDSFENIKNTKGKKFSKKSSLDNLDKLKTKNQNKIEKKIRKIKNKSNSHLLSFVEGKNYFLENNNIFDINKLKNYGSNFVKKEKKNSCKIIKKNSSLKKIKKTKKDFYLLNKKKKKVNSIKNDFMTNSNILVKKSDNFWRPFTSQNEKSKLLNQNNFEKINLKKIEFKNMKFNEEKLKKSDNVVFKIDKNIKKNEKLNRKQNHFLDFRKKLDLKKKNNLIKKNLLSKKIKVKEKKLMTMKNKPIVFSSSDICKKKLMRKSIFNETYGKFFDNKKKIQKNFSTKFI